MFNKKAQQELMGFVLIVVLVVIAMIVFLVISLRQPTTQIESLKTQNILSSLLDYTTECIVSEPQYDSIRDLVGNCYDNDQCQNLGVSACDYLNQTVPLILPEMFSTDAEVSAYEFDISWESDDKSLRQNYLYILSGNCNQTSSTVVGSSEPISARSGTIIVSVKICAEI